MFEISTVYRATAALGRAHQNAPETIPAREADLLAARVKHHVARIVNEAKGAPLQPHHREALCAFLAEVGK